MLLRSQKLTKLIQSYPNSNKSGNYHSFQRAQSTQTQNCTALLVLMVFLYTALENACANRHRTSYGLFGSQ